ncbi:MotE family protein [Waltera sp.]|uniref:MotE family protein n=1 Tax=Waltera sp. TaxID=2815806 RepID=UPI003AB2AC0E
MAREKTPEENAADNERKQLVEEKKNLKKDQQAQRKEAKRRAREIAKQEDELEDGNEGNSLLTFGATILIVALWLAVICVIIKLDIGGFGSSVVTPILKDVPVLNRILPGNSVTETTNSGAYGGYTSLQDAVDQIKSLELQLEQIQNASSAKDEELDQLKAEVLRLKEFENQQVEFQRIQKEFYDEVVYSDKGPGAEEYKKYYESMDPATAEYIYKQVVTQLQESQEVQDYAAAYSAMKPKQAAAIFEQMTNNLDLAARILKVMSADDRGAILGAMNSEVAAKITKIMDPES